MVFSPPGPTLLTLLPDERPEDLYQKLMAFVEYNLLHTGSCSTHHHEAIQEDKELTSLIEDFVVLMGLPLIHSYLSKYVKQRCGTELSHCTLALIKPDISQDLNYLCDEHQIAEDARAMRSAISYNPKFKQQSRTLKLLKNCPICKGTGRPDTHFSKVFFTRHRIKNYWLRHVLLRG